MKIAIADTGCVGLSNSSLLSQRYEAVMRGVWRYGLDLPECLAAKADLTCRFLRRNLPQYQALQAEQISESDPI